MTIRSNPMIRASILAAGLALTACGGGGSGSSVPAAGPTTTPTTGGTTPPATSGTATTPGVWKGTISSTTTGQAATVVALTGHDGHSIWMTTDGRIFDGELPPSGDHFSATFSDHMYEGDHFPDGTNYGTASMLVDHHTTMATSGRYAGSGDAGMFNMSLSPMWDRAASLGAAAGVYTRSTSSGYTMTMTLDANGQMTGSDSKGCVITGTVSVPDPQHNLYHLDAQVSTCGSLDGHYQGTGALLDADAMQDWMTAMHPLELGGHSHGGSMMGGQHYMGHNTVPTGQQNLFMFSMVSAGNALMDALAR